MTIGHHSGLLNRKLCQGIYPVGLSHPENKIYPIPEDGPHNYIWKKRIAGEDYYIHRKGACCAGGCEEMEGTEFAYYGEPVMIPGSMGSSSYLLRGLGNPDCLWSASHGARRKKSRRDTIKGNDYDEVIAVHTAHDMAAPVARLEPVFTVKS